MTSRLTNHNLVTEEGDVLIPLTRAINIDNHMRSNLDHSNTYLVNQVSESLSSIKCTPELFKSLLKQMKQATPYYGMLIHYDKVRLNPMHPVTAKLIGSGIVNLPAEFTLTIYKYKADEKLDTEKAAEYITKLSKILAEIPTTSDITLHIKPNDTFEHDSKALTPKQFHSHSIRISNSESNPANALMPVQYIQKGVVYPFYGLVYAEFRDSKYRGMSLFPYLTGNVDSRNHGMGTVCTGDLSNRNFANLTVINTLNHASTYFSDNSITSHYREFAFACQQLSTTLILGA
jgi:hypothetical protein